MSEELRVWARRLELALARPGMLVADRAAVLDACDSTQDQAHALADGQPGLVVVAARQNAGRGRLGRRWHDAQGLGVAITFVLDASAFDPGELALLAGLAACFTAEAALELDNPASAITRGVLGAVLDPAGAIARAMGGAGVGLRWPNDVVAWPTPAARASPLKLAGCLVEVRDGLALLGIGVNVGHRREDFPPEVADKAVSLGMLGSAWDRADVIERLVIELDRAIQTPPEQAGQAWSARDTLVGSTQTFEHDARRYTGLVQAIDPLGSLRIQTATGPVDLPALTTSLVKE